MRSAVQVSYRAPKIEKAFREDILALQWKKIKYQIEYLFHQNPFYQKKFKENNLTPDKIKTRDDFQRIPFTLKEEVVEDQKNNPPYGLRLGANPDKLSEVHTTGGTSGKGQEIHALTRMDRERSAEVWALHFHWAGLRKGDAAVLIAPMGPLAAPLTFVHSWEKMGTNPFRLGPFDTKTRLTMMMKFKPRLAFIPGVYLIRMMDECRALGIDPRKDFSSLKTISTAGGAYPLSFAEAIEEFWDVRLHEVYGAAQQGTGIAMSCERGVIFDGKRGFLHIPEHEVLVEVLNRETGKPVMSGEEGEVVITSFFREISPVLRFRLHDRARYFSYRECPCGRPFDLIEAGTIARYDDMLKIKGNNVWVHDVDEIIFSHPEIDEYNGRVTITEKGGEEAVINVEFKTNLTLLPEAKKKTIKDIVKRLADKYHLRFVVNEVPFGTVERFEMKQRRWTDERQKLMEERTKW